ncbi:MAG: hypothetical protein DRP58_12220 [Spirochaetes bacterium]|nr:MAG: hypothetical protein DRP58_12220 [Spirochaetota bacterium]
MSITIETTNLVTSDGTTFESIFRCESKADKRAEFNLFFTKETYVRKLSLVEKVMQEEGFKAIELEHSANKKLSRYLTKYYLLLDSDIRMKIKEDLVKLLVKEVAIHELPLNSLVEQMQLRISDVFQGDMALKAKYNEGEVENVFASIIVAMGYKLGLFRIVKQEAKVVNDVYQHEYDLVEPTLAFTEQEIKYLHKKTLKEPSHYQPKIKESGAVNEGQWFSGDSIKFNREQPQFVWDRINKISSYAYQINERLYKDFAPLFRQTFATQKEAKKFDEVVKENLGKKLHFDAKYTADNGRINIIGYYLGAQVGARNHLIEVHEDDKQYLTEEDRAKFVTLIENLEGSDKLADKLERLAYLQAIADHDEGKKVGILVDFDGKLSGQQGMAVLCRSKSEAYYSGMLSEFEDGYLSLAACVGLDRRATKGGFQGYQYGAGKDTTIKGILEEGGHAIDFEAWEAGFAKIFPASYKLMKFIKELTKKADLGHRIDYTNPAGFRAVITSYETFTTTYNNVFGRDRAHHIKVIKSNDFGAQPVAVTGHFMDASVQSFILDACDFPILPVHDNFRSMMGDTPKVLEAHIDANRYLVKQPILEAYINEAYAPYLEYFGYTADVSELIVGDLKDTDIVGGLY